MEFIFLLLIVFCFLAMLRVENKRAIAKQQAELMDFLAREINDHMGFANTNHGGSSVAESYHTGRVEAYQHVILFLTMRR